jgi:GNAT superfamily N-acetyltransferase
MSGGIQSASSLELRAASPDDERFLCQVYAATRSSELAMVAWTDTEKSAFVEMQFRAQAQYYRDHYPNTSYDVILLDGQGVGRLYVARWSNEIRIVDIALLPASCNRGIGTTLLRQLQAEAQAAAKPLRIHVERFNPALRLYERLGFREIEDKGVYLFMEWRAHEDDNSQLPTANSQGESLERSGRKA